MLDRVLDDRVLREGIASVFGVPADEVRIVDQSSNGALADGIATEAPVRVEWVALEAVTVDAGSLDERDAFVVSQVDRVVRLAPIAV